MAKIRCSKCRGQKKYFGIGGLEKDCEVCDKTGLVEHEATVKESSIVESNASTVSMSELLADAGVPATIIEEMATAPVVAPVDELLAAVLAEPSMEAMAWARAYAHVPGLFGKSMITGLPEELITKVGRNAMREQHAMSMPIAPRSVDLGAQQDSTVEKSKDYQAYVKQEKLATERALSTGEKHKAVKVK